jgi:DNA invertase Pin-like site-specific DNA recombinase
VRAGFERMVAEVCLGQVGAVAAREVSRFARNSRDWQKLVEVCRVVDTLLIDQEMVYTPRQSNDRLLLGLKGSLNEYELDLRRQRSVEARLGTARHFSEMGDISGPLLKAEHSDYPPLARRVESLPGVQGAAVAMPLPMMGYAGSPVQDAAKSQLKLNEV